HTVNRAGGHPNQGDGRAKTPVIAGVFCAAALRLPQWSGGRSLWTANRLVAHHSRRSFAAASPIDTALSHARFLVAIWIADRARDDGAVVICVEPSWLWASALAVGAGQSHVATPRIRGFGLR